MKDLLFWWHTQRSQDGRLKVTFKSLWGLPLPTDLKCCVVCFPYENLLGSEDHGETFIVVDEVVPMDDDAEDNDDMEDDTKDECSYGDCAYKQNPGSRALRCSSNNCSFIIHIGCFAKYDNAKYKTYRKIKSKDEFKSTWKCNGCTQ